MAVLALAVWASVAWAGGAAGGAAGGGAAAELRWSGGSGRIVVEAPGEHIGGGPARLAVEGAAALSWEAGDEAAAAGLSALRFPVAAGEVSARLEVSLCRDDGSACRMAVFEVAGEVAGRRGGLRALEIGASGGAAPAAGAAVELLDFTAVWCPPCNRMAAEILDDPAERAILAPYRVRRVDVDRPESWEVKSRYAVGGYPTVIAVDAAGDEVDRLVGYPGEEAMRRWIAGLADRAALASGSGAAGSGAAGSGAAGSGAGAGDPGAAAREARRLAETGREEEAARLLGAAPGADPSGQPWEADLRVARLLAGPEERRGAEARWLLGAGVAGGDWVYSAIEALQQEEVAAAELWAMLVPVMTAAGPLEAAGWMDMAAGEDPALAAAALVTLEGALSGDPERDRGYWLDLASLYARAGRPADGEALLRRGAERWPEEFTFHYALARALMEPGREDGAGALAAAERAWAVAYGDQRLRAAVVLAKLRAQAGDRAGALAVIDQALAEIPEPPPGLEVRTRRYRAQAAALRAELAAVP